MPPSAAPSASARLCDVSLPKGYVVWSWKVRNGSSVRAGETIATAAPVDGSTPSASAPVATTQAPTYKRPQSRKKKATATVEHTVTKLAAPETKSNAPAPSSLKAVTSNANGIFRMVEQSTASATSTEEALVIGYVEECQHPTIIDGLCAVCGSKVESKPNNASNSATNAATNSESNGAPDAMSRMTVAGLNVSVSHAEGQRMVQQDTERLHKLRKLSLVLDLDHTLVHATADPRAEQYTHRSDVRNLILPVVVPTTRGLPPPPVWYQRHFVKIRPYVKEFLEMALEQYEISVYTAGTREYAEQIAILLARHLVGTSHDQVELDRLRQHVAHLTAHQESFRRATPNRHPTLPPENKPSEAGAERTQHDTNDLEHEPSGKERISKGATNTMESKGKPAEAETANAKDDTSGPDHDGSTKESSRDDAINGDDTKATGAKRKRVTFDALPPPTATRVLPIGDENLLAKLQAELETAERLEVQALELRQKLFGSRVVSRTEVGDLGRDVKSLKRIFPCGGSMAAVIDDREDVWANAEEMASTRRGEPPENLLLVRPYHWNSFLGFADVNNASGVDLTGQTPHVESDSDEQLVWTADILQRLHFRYFSSRGTDQPTVPDVLAKMRREVLAGCNVVLSGLVPLDKQTHSSSRNNVPRPPFVRYAESLGATLLSSIEDSVTHVVGNRDGTDKIVKARRINGCHVVKASWLVECVWSVTRRDESAYLLGQPKPTSRPDNKSSKVTAPLVSSGTATAATLPTATLDAASTTHETASTTSSDEDNDDDFADMLADEMSKE